MLSDYLVVYEKNRDISIIIFRTNSVFFFLFTQSTQNIPIPPSNTHRDTIHPDCHSVFVVIF